MGSNGDQFIGLTEAAQILGRTPEDVQSLCNEGLIRRRSTGHRVLVHRGDVDEVVETNLNDTARPRDLVKRVVLLERQVRSLTKALDLYGAVIGMTTSSLDGLGPQELVELSQRVSAMLHADSWTVDEMFQFCEVFLRISDTDILRLNDSVGSHESWRIFYTLCLRMAWWSRNGDLEPGRDLDTVRVLLQ